MASTGDGVNWSDVRGITVASGNLHFALANGNLYRIAWDGTRPIGPATQVGGPALDGTNSASREIFAFTPSGNIDTTPTTTPGKPSGASTSTSSIGLSWTASSDASPPITYRIYRDGGGNPIGQTTATNFLDTNLAAGSTHTYRVDAVDAVGNVGALSPPSDPITVRSGPGDAIFTDDFATGDFANWTTVSNLTIDQTSGAAAAPSARGNPAGRRAFARRDLSSGLSQACLSGNYNVSNLGPGGLVLMRLRTAAGGPVTRTLVNAAGVLNVRSDFAGASTSSGVVLGPGWHTVELCTSVGASGVVDLYLDGAQIVAGWATNTGTTPIGRIELGDDGAKTWTANFDDVTLDEVPG